MEPTRKSLTKEFWASCPLTEIFNGLNRARTHILEQGGKPTHISVSRRLFIEISQRITGLPNFAFTFRYDAQIYGMCLFLDKGEYYNMRVIYENAAGMSSSISVSKFLSIFEVKDPEPLGLRFT